MMWNIDTNLADKVLQATRHPAFIARLQFEQRTAAFRLCVSLPTNFSHSISAQVW